MSALRTGLGVVLGLTVGAVVSTVLYGCSCPPGYKPKKLAPGNYKIQENDAGFNADTLVVTDQTITVTQPRGTSVYVVEYQITGAR